MALTVDDVDEAAALYGDALNLPVVKEWAGSEGRGIIFAVKTYTCVLTVGAVLGYLGAPQIIQTFRNDPDVIAIGVKAFRYQCLIMPLMPVFVFSNMIFQGMGKSFRATTLAVCRPVFFMALAMVLCGAFGLMGLEVSQPIADLLSFLLSAALLLRLMRGELREADP